VRHRSLRTHLDAEVVQRPDGAGPTGIGVGGLEQDQLQRRVGDGEVGVAGAALGRLGLEQLAVEGDRGVQVAQPTVSHHLKVLHDAGLVTREKRGPWVYYRAVPARLAAVAAALTDIKA
jgi:DNA-binding transcriptional ArsR family regulator